MYQAGNPEYVLRRGGVRTPVAGEANLQFHRVPDHYFFRPTITTQLSDSP